MIYDFTKYKELRRIDEWNSKDPALIWMELWFNGMTMFLPRVTIEAKLLHFPEKQNPKSTPEEPKVK